MKTSRWGVSLVLAAGVAAAGELMVGAAEVSITPERPIALAGHFATRITKRVESPCMANVLVLESRKDGKTSDHAIIVAVDAVSVPSEVQKEFRARVGEKIPELNQDKLIMTATHTHNGPTLNQNRFTDYGEAMQPDEYLPFMYERLEEAVVKAWRTRRPGDVSWGLGHAVVAQNRRAAYSDGSAEMYGKVNVENFIGLEGWEDHAVDIICFTDKSKKLVATAIAVPCPSQVVESQRLDKQYIISSDYWGNVRELLKAKYGQDLTVVGLCGPAGDMVPRPMLRKNAESRMNRLRGEVAGIEAEPAWIAHKREIGRRIANTFHDVWSLIQHDTRADIVFEHRVERFTVPHRKVTLGDVERAKKDAAELERRALASKDAGYQSACRKRKQWHLRVVERYEEQQKKEMNLEIEIHVLRIGDLAIATNPFELFQDYAMRIHGRSAAEQTMLVQLAGHSPAAKMASASYLPSERAAKAGGYSGVPQSTPIGPVGGQMLVEKTVEVIGEMF